MPRILIIGAGPCGLGAGLRLESEGFADWLILEQNAWAGGLAASFPDEQGFTWDVGGHVLFSHFKEFDGAIADVMGDDMLAHRRQAYIRFRGRWIPYPFQYNVHHLPLNECVECLASLAQIPAKPDTTNFLTWNRTTLGTRISGIFMEPYNLKVWSHPLEGMSASWIAERVATIDLRRALRNAIQKTDEPAWGPNAAFAFPKSGGTGEIYRRMAARLGERIVFDEKVVEVDVGRRRVRTARGTTYDFETLISSSALQDLIPAIPGAPEDVRAALGRLEYNSLLIFGFGFRRPTRHDQCWMYFCEEAMPAYRVTNFGHYSPGNLPDGRDSDFCSYMCEVSFPRAAAADAPVAELAEALRAGLAAAELIGTTEAPVTTYTLKVDRGYPIPTLGRDAALTTIEAYLSDHGVLSRGRFGAYRYEIGNMDHSFMMGWEAAGRAAKGTAEKLLAGTK